MPETGAREAEDRFIADCMLGRLAKWLRVLGFDAAYDRRISDDRLVARARAEARVLLTRDTRLVQRRAFGRDGAPYVLILSDRPDEQLLQVVTQRRLDLSARPLLARCLRCNEPTVAATRESVVDRVPPYVLRTQERFSRCPACDRIYWRATHVAGIVERLASKLGYPRGPAPPA
jgi:uncharacterized protein